MYDVVIIGGGPAGLAAAIYFARQKMHFAIVTGDIGGKALWSSDVENYLGFHLLDGVDLVKRFREHLQDYASDYDLKEGVLVTKIEKIGETFRILTNKDPMEAKTILIATGEDNRKLNVPGEKELNAKGITYCAHCDAPLFKGKNVHVIGGGNSAMDAALLCAKYSPCVTLVCLNPNLAGDEVMRMHVQNTKQIRILTSCATTRILGETCVTGIALKDQGGERIEQTAAVLIEIGLVPMSGFATLVERDQSGQIMVDKLNQTSVKGIWAAGDVTDISEKQISVAVGEGSKAALEIIHYFQTQV